ncbi:MAG TPA: hypothetical protein DCS50_05500, partial [Acidaminococcaceae bacterium]|nr:hypothetical protein [Acidaminococcaceae bacterium]
ATEIVEIRLLPANLSSMALSADGVRICEIGQHDIVRITKNRKTMQLIRLTDRSYYETWQEKLIRGV